MLLFSTILNINDSMTKEKFIELVIEWNKNSPHEDNIIPKLIWNGEMNTRYGTDNLWLEIQEFRNKNIVGIRFEKNEGNGTIWNTDYIMNFNEMKMAIRLDRSFKHDAINVSYNYSTPYFINLLIDRGFVKPDNGIPVMNKPYYINRDNIELLTCVINEKEKHDLPVIYVSKTINERDPIDVDVLAKNVKGSALVLVEESRVLNYPLRELCDDKNEYNGAVGIYYSNSAVKNDRFLPPKYERGREILLKKIVRRVTAMHNSQYVDQLYTWEGLLNSLTMDRVLTQKEKRQAAESEKELIWDTLDDDFRKMEEQNSELIKEIERLKYENQGLMMKISEDEGMPVIIFGDEEDLFSGEIKDIVLSELDKANNNLMSDSRRSHVLSDILAANDYQRLLEKKQKEAKNIFKGVKNVTGRKKNQIKDFGFAITEDGKHYKLRYYDDSRYQVSMAKTSSDVRAGANLAAEIIKKML